MNIKLCDKTIVQVNNTKFLGLTIEDNLSWSLHINNISSKISKSLGLMYKAKKVLPGLDLLPLYYSYIFPYLIYALPIWGGSSPMKLQPILKNLKRAIRIMANVKQRQSITQAFYDLKMLKVPELYIYYLAIFMYKSINQLIAPQFAELYEKNEQLGIRSTRQSTDIHIPKLVKPKTQLNIRLRGATIWRDILDKPTFDCPISSFKKYILDKLLESYDQR